jgi:hypothetical protein
MEPKDVMDEPQEYLDVSVTRGSADTTVYSFRSWIMPKIAEEPYAWLSM